MKPRIRSEPLAAFSTFMLAESFGWLLYRLHTDGHCWAFTYITIAQWLTLTVLFSVMANKATQP